jgi:glycosyltransferase involved in cell wall biosynthesis
MKISFISNIKLTESSGGMSGINNALYHQIGRYFELSDYIHINVKPDYISKIYSKIQGLLGIKRKYHFFSNRRLNHINQRFNAQSNSSDAYFFLGFTSWIDITPNKPYYCYNDASFATYVEIYNNKDEFSKKDLKRIYEKEKAWLANANKVFFNSNWALEKTKKAYGLDGKNFMNIGFGGFIAIPEQDCYIGGYNFLFITLEFKPKGGKIVAEAIQIVRKTHPDANIWVVGEKPPEEILALEGIIYKGYFSKSDKQDYQMLLEIFSQSFCLVHPTLKDTTTLVITESAYFGCPAIASKRFAIPESVIHKETGLLLDEPRNPKELAEKMCYMIEHPELYNKMRERVRLSALENSTWEKVGDRLNDLIKS